MNFFDVQGFGADFAYTVDGGPTNVLNYECFNACTATVTVQGVNVHPGTAKNIMKNAALIATEFVALLPPAETPAHTEKREGFYHLASIQGEEIQATLKYILRDHDRAKLRGPQSAHTLAVAAFLNGRYGEGTVTVALKDTYFNMGDEIDKASRDDRTRDGRPARRGRNAGGRAHPRRHRRLPPYLSWACPAPTSPPARTTCTASWNTQACPKWKKSRASSSRSPRHGKGFRPYHPDQGQCP